MSVLKQSLLSIEDVNTAFKIDGKFYPAIKNIDLDVNRDEILAIVGESGCGKSTLADTIMGLLDPNESRTSGKVIFDKKNLLDMNEKILNTYRGVKIGMIFQDPLSALDPLKRIGDQVAESLVYHTNDSASKRYDRVIYLLNKVGIDHPKLVEHEFPHQLSGGMRQRVVIAMAIACEPDLIIADEPTTALDVTIQAQILDLLKSIQADNHCGIILITHDLGVVAETADRVAVMYAGQIVELGNVEQIFNTPKHPYTRSLLRSMPQNSDHGDDLYVIQGSVPSLKKMPTDGDLFAPRIPWVSSDQHEKHPKMHEIDSGHWVRCTCYQHFQFPDEERGSM
ncbi:ABC transporter ATP-binding protein [Apilactobacillus apisilvae]|uniref:ABC transporter ATP-binding protein n=1 Tax=Apilactobacillus apisilvae TaxID=2923364 RepID=A0ABY4PFV6_9LACO|nr:ABC transporter ATP-binding protein [Apilactobacillus apisilvae]UQS84465.1 ABC transporter ATP-binding protein [Apilactobacillus apisilvae]